MHWLAVYTLLKRQAGGGNRSLQSTDQEVQACAQWRALRLSLLGPAQRPAPGINIYDDNSVNETRHGIIVSYMYGSDLRLTMIKFPPYRPIFGKFNSLRNQKGRKHLLARLFRSLSSAPNNEPGRTIVAPGNASFTACSPSYFVE